MDTYNLNIDNTKQGTTNSKEVIQDVLTALPDLKFRSVPALQEMYRSLLDISIELAQKEREKSNGGERSSLTRFIKSMNKWREHELSEERIPLLTLIYDAILQLEGMGLLMGFGLSTYEKGEEGRLKVGKMNLLNPEKESMYGSFTNKGGFTMAKKVAPIVIGKEELAKVAKELNEVLGIDPPIDVGGEADALKAQILEAQEKLITPDDDFSEETSKILKVFKEEKTPTPAPKAAKENEKKVEPKKTEPAPKKEEPPKEKAKEAPKEKAAAPVKAVRGKVMADILIESAKTPMTKKEMVDKMLKTYGGTEVDAYFYVSYSLRLTKELGLLEKGKDETLSYKA